MAELLARGCGAHREVGNPVTNATAYDEDLVETLADVLIARGVAYPRGMVYATDILARLT